MDEYGSFSIKHRSSEAEEQKYFVFLKILKDLEHIQDSDWLKCLLKRFYETKVTKRKYEFKTGETACRKNRPKGLGRKIRNIEVETYVLRNLVGQASKLEIPNRKSCVFWAKKWIEQFGKSKYEEFKASKGWASKFIKRNLVQIHQ